MKKIGFLFLFVQTALFAIIPQNPILSSYWVAPHNDSVMIKVADKFEVVRKLNGGYEILVPLFQTNQLLSLVPEAQLLELDISSGLKKISRGELQGYHNFSTVQSHLQSIEANFPQLARIEKYGESMEGRPLLSLKLSGPLSNKLRPAILLTAATHGDELITVEVLFGLLDSLIARYGKEPRLTALLDQYEIYFIPVVNPDGYIRTERYANGIDPNRDYPWPQDPNHKANPCISGLMKFYETHQIKASIDFHAFGEMIMYPWAYTYDSLPSLEDATFDRITTQMADFNGYVHGQISKVIYVAKGSSADYFHWKHHAWALGIEVGNQKIPAASEIAEVIKANSDSTWTFIESIH